MNVRQAILAALRGEPALISKISDSLRQRLEDDEGRMSRVVQAAEALEPILQDAVEKKPSRLSHLGLKSAQVLAGLTADDQRSSSELAALAKNSVVGIVFVDVAGFTAFTEEMGDENAIALLSELDGLTGRATKAGRGKCVKKLGDGYLLAFPSASQAVRAAVSLRDRALTKRASDQGFPLPLRLAVHAGEPLVEQDDLLGHDVNLTARLLDYTDPDEIVVSEVAKEMAERRLKKIAFGYGRTVKIRGLTTPVTVYTVNPLKAPSSLNPLQKLKSGYLSKSS
ncbi:MAG: adenylate/guanylate cyclase domain-containing protein [Actinomycetota bacterium]